jgi:hypothetical protein
MVRLEAEGETAEACLESLGAKSIKRWIEIDRRGAHGPVLVVLRGKLHEFEKLDEAERFVIEAMRAVYTPDTHIFIPGRERRRGACAELSG